MLTFIICTVKSRDFASTFYLVFAIQIWTYTFMNHTNNVNNHFAKEKKMWIRLFREENVFVWLIDFGHLTKVHLQLRQFLNAMVLALQKIYKLSSTETVRPEQSQQEEILKQYNKYMETKISERFLPKKQLWFRWIQIQNDDWKWIIYQLCFSFPVSRILYIYFRNLSFIKNLVGNFQNNQK